MPLPESRESYWNATARPGPEFPHLSGEPEVDVAIVGGGIVGVTAARLLKDRGVRVALVEALRVGRQVTGQSTAKVTVQHNVIYGRLAKTFGEERAGLYAEAQTAGLRMIEQLVARHGIEADLEPAPAFVWTDREDELDRLREEAEIARRLGLDYKFITETGLPFEVAGAIRADGQAQFQPTDYVAGLAATLPGEGCHVFEHSRVRDWSPTHVETADGAVKAGKVIMATHLPLGQIGAYYARTEPKAEPMAAAPVERDIGGMYISSGEPHLSIRTHRNRNGRLHAVAVGRPFKPGHTEEARESFEALTRWLREHFAPEGISHRWVNEDYRPMDGAPFVGWSSGNGHGYLAATGFDAWGLTNGTAAAIMLADLAVGLDHPWLALFRADRVKPVAGGAQFVKASVSVAAHLVGGYLSRRHHSLERLARGQAEVLKIEGENVAAWRDENGGIHAVSAVCSHMGCVVGWNEADRTWDCPCHGSRFTPDGEVLHGPAVTPLEERVEAGKGVRARRSGAG